MIREFEIRSFKSLEGVSIELGRINVFIGANGRGKSNLLEALGVMGASASGRVDDESLLRRGVRPGLPVLYKSSFRNSRQPDAIQFAAASGDAKYSVSLFNPLTDPEPAWRFKTESLYGDGRKLVGRSPASRLNLDPAFGYTALKAVEMAPNSSASRLINELRQYAIYSPDTSTLRGLDTDPQTREPIGLGGGRLAEAVQSIMRQGPTPQLISALNSVRTMIDWMGGFVVSSPYEVPVSKNIPQPTKILRFRDKYMADKRNYLSGYDASEGALYVLFMFVLAHHQDAPPILAVDNFDHALNPRLAMALTRKLCDWVLMQENRQFLLTSHNPLVLDGLPLGNDEVRLFTVERSHLGKTMIRRIEIDDQLIQAAEDGIPLSQQWVTGSIGGVPAI